MNITKKMCTASDTIRGWNEIDFHTAEKSVKSLQMRIAHAQQEAKSGKVRFLQDKLIHSFYAKALAVKKVTSNKGKHTPGIDGILWTTPEEKWKAIFELDHKGYEPKPLKRVYLPGKDGKNRPIGIPTMRDRAMQTLYKLVLEPIAELTADCGSYGYRNGRSARDAIIRCTDILSENPCSVWVFEADIQSCYDNISHEWVLKYIPLEEDILRKFLTSGYIEAQKLYPSDRGIPQGGSISPVICNMVLDGLEDELKTKFRADIHFIRYADDFIVIGESKDLLKQSVIPLINDFLSARGLELSPEKTALTHIENGFDFLGWNVCKEGKHLIVRPSERNRNSLLEKIEVTVKRYSHRPSADTLNKALRSIVIGWLTYHRGVVIDYSLYEVEYDVVSLMFRLTQDRHLAVFASSLFSSV